MRFPNRDSTPNNLVHFLCDQARREEAEDLARLWRIYLGNPKQTKEEKDKAEEIVEAISGYIRYKTRRETLGEFVLAANDFSDFEKIDVPYHIISEHSQAEEELEESFSWFKLLLECKNV